jgi:hypothetical protein
MMNMFGQCGAALNFRSEYMTVFMAVLLAASLTLARGQSRDPVTAEAVPKANVIALAVHNGAALPLTAFAYRSEPVVTAGATVLNPGWSFYDALTNQVQAQISPHQSTTAVDYPRSGNAGIRTKVPIAAGVFADGSSFGDPAMVSRILQRRKYMLAAIDAVIADLNREMQEGKKKDEVTSELASHLGLALNTAVDEDQRECLLSTYQPAIQAVTATLRDAPMPVLPYQAMRAQISSLTARRNRLAGIPPVKP